MGGAALLEAAAVEVGAVEVVVAEVVAEVVAVAVAVVAARAEAARAASRVVAAAAAAVAIRPQKRRRRRSNPSTRPGWWTTRRSGWRCRPRSLHSLTRQPGVTLMVSTAARSGRRSTFSDGRCLTLGGVRMACLGREQATGWTWREPLANEKRLRTPSRYWMATPWTA